MRNRFADGRGQGSRPVQQENAMIVIRRSEIEAKRERAKFIEAEHMLLAIATQSDSVAARLLTESGLDRTRIASALSTEQRRSLAFVGMAPLNEKQAEATELDSSPALGTSAKAAIKRAMIASRSNRRRRFRLDSTHLLLGILLAELGTVPRALAIAGVDRAELISRTRGSE